MPNAILSGRAVNSVIAASECPFNPVDEPERAALWLAFKRAQEECREVDVSVAERETALARHQRQVQSARRLRASHPSRPRQTAAARAAEEEGTRLEGELQALKTEQGILYHNRHEAERALLVAVFGDGAA